MTDKPFLAAFLAAIQGVHISGAGTKETWYYTALNNFLVIEAKSPGETVEFNAASAQVAKYWDRYRLVLVTNLRDWLLIGERDGMRVALEQHTLARTEVDFWALAEHPSKALK